MFAIMPLLTHAGLPNTADGAIHLMRQVELNQAWNEGNFYPRWGTDLAFGHGMPIFSYAPPALYYLTQFFHLFGLPLDAAMKTVVVLDFLLYSVGMFLLARRIFGSYPALIAATAHVYAPYRLREAYIQGNYGQFTGLACYAFIFWSFHALITDGRPRYAIAAAVSLAALLFSHNISSMIFAPMFAAYLILLTIVRSKKKLPYFLLLTSYSLLLGLGLAAIFWLPAFGEKNAIKLEGITRGFFDFRENFISLPEYLSPPLPLDRTAINPKFPLGLGLAQIIGAALAGLFYVGFLKSKIKNQKSLFLIPYFLFFLLLYAFLAIPPSQFLWEAIPLLELTEFPWRMLGPAVFCASFLTAVPFWILQNKEYEVRSKKYSHIPYSLLLTPYSLLLIIALNLHYLYPSQFIQWGTPTPANAFAYEIQSGAIGTTSTGEFLPRATQQHPKPDTMWPDYAAGRLPQRLDPTTLPTGATIETLYHRAESEAFLINTPRQFTATLRLLYWPGWQIYLNGQRADFTVTKPTGLIQTVVPRGQHTLTLQLESTPLRAAGKWLTMLSIIGLIVLGISGQDLTGFKNLSGLNVENKSVSLKFFGLTTVLLVSGYLLSRPLESFFTMQSDPNRPQPADQILQADFADQIRLVGMDNLASPTISLADASNLTAILYWRALRKLDTNYAMFLHLDANGQTFATADERSPENIPTRNWPTGLYLRNPLHLKIPPDLPPMRYDVTVGLYNHDTGQRLNLADGQTSFKIGTVWLTAPAPPLPAKPLAHFGAHITLWQTKLQTQTLTLYWQTSQPLEHDYRIFIHVLDDHELLAQADGVPYDGLYPLTNWLPSQIIVDTRQLKPFARPITIAIGIYDPANGQRLSATDTLGQSLVDDSFRLKIK